MDNNEVKRMTLLAKKLKEEKRSNEEILKSFVAAGILTPDGNYTKNYSALESENAVQTSKSA